eukprot:m.14594 g.14594  ORF g.14594 m.14594 type:complete len:741 (+) comp25845_c0_seq2:95-2317(+)
MLTLSSRLFWLLSLVCPTFEFQIRLVGGRQEYEGRVEIRFRGAMASSDDDVLRTKLRQEVGEAALKRGVWGTVCDDKWDAVDANVVCRQLGYERAVNVYHASHFGGGTGMIWMDEVQCKGEEKRLADCPFNGWHEHNCNHAEDAGVQCYVPPVRFPGILPVRLVGDNGGGSRWRKTRKGRPEVFLDDTWSAIDGNGFGPEEGRVFCAQLGFPYGRRFISRRILSFFQPWNGTVVMKRPLCSGAESALSYCMAVNWGPHSFTGGNGSWWKEKDLAYVHCTLKPVKKLKSAGSASKDTSSLVRLKGGIGPWEGRLEVSINGQWGTICDRDMTSYVANAACRQSGYGSAKRVLHYAWFGRGLGPIHMRGIKCIGNESSLMECHLPPPKHDPSGCKHFMDSSVECYKPETSNKIVRLSSFSRETDAIPAKHGFVEVRKNVDGPWFPICDVSWGHKEAQVVCRQLELGYAEAARQRPYNKELVKYFQADYTCEGNEVDLLGCKPQRRRIQSNCSAGAAWVSCKDKLPDLLPDVEALRFSLRQQVIAVRLSSYQCAIEEKCFSASAYNRTDDPLRYLIRFTTRIMNLGRADFEPHANRDEWHWHQCHNHYHSFEAFSFYEVINSAGVRQVAGHKASFCLEDSDCLENGPPPRYYYYCSTGHAGRGGHQGISANCADSYFSHLDCQWVDVTGLAHGNYRLVVAVNPHRKVAEMDFENNAVFCEFTYSGHGFLKLGECGFMPDFEQLF